MSKRKHKIDDPEEINQNLDERIGIPLTIEEFGIAAWTPARDGKGEMEAVAMHFSVNHPTDPSKGPLLLGMRIKTPERMDWIVAVLRQYQALVWPDHVPGSGVDDGAPPA